MFSLLTFYHFAKCRKITKQSLDGVNVSVFNNCKHGNIDAQISTLSGQDSGNKKNIAVKKYDQHRNNLNLIKLYTISTPALSE